MILLAVCGCQNCNHANTEGELSKRMKQLKNISAQEHIAKYKELIKEYPHSKQMPRMLHYLASGYRRIEDHKKAEETYYKIIKKYPDSKQCLTAIYGIRNIYRETENTIAFNNFVKQTAIPVIEKHIELYSKDRDIALKRNRAWDVLLLELYGLNNDKDKIKAKAPKVASYYLIIKESNEIELIRIAKVLNDIGETEQSRKIINKVKQASITILNLIQQEIDRQNNK